MTFRLQGKKAAPEVSSSEEEDSDEEESDDEPAAKPAAKVSQNILLCLELMTFSVQLHEVFDRFSVRIMPKNF